MNGQNDGGEKLEISEIGAGEEEDAGEEPQQDEVYVIYEYLRVKKTGSRWAINLNEDMRKSVNLKWKDLTSLQEEILDLLDDVNELQMALIDPLRLQKDHMEADLIFTCVHNEILRLNSSLWHLKNDYTASNLTMDPDQAPEERQPPPFIIGEGAFHFLEDKEVEIDTMEQGDYKRNVIALLEEKIQEMFKSYPVEEARKAEDSESDFFFVVVDSCNNIGDKSITSQGIAGNRNGNGPCRDILPFSCKIKLTDGSYTAEEFTSAKEWKGFELEEAVPQFIYSISSDSFILLAHDTSNPDDDDSKLQARILHLFHEKEHKNCYSVKVADGISCSFR